jgi:cell division protein FtsN
LAPQVKPPATASLLDRLDAVQADAGGADGLTFQEELTRRSTPERPVATAIHAPTVRTEHPSPTAIILPTPPSATPGPSALIAVHPMTDAGSADSPIATREVSPEPFTQPLQNVDPTEKGTAQVPFTVQVKATQSQGEADKFAAKLRLQGYHSSVAAADVAGKGKWYRVRVGHFDTRAEAEHYLTDFERETHLSAFVTQVNH